MVVSVVARYCLRRGISFTVASQTDFMSDQSNVYGTALETCSEDPTTGYLRDGCCQEHPADRGRHEICAVMTEEFLQFSATQGNDLGTPRPEYDFPGLDSGDQWCLCLGRWIEAEQAGVAPPLVLEATNESVLEAVSTDLLKAYGHD